MDSNKTLDSTFGTRFKTVGDVLAIPIQEITTVLESNDANAAVNTFKAWAPTQHLVVADLNINFLMVGKAL